MCCFFLTLKKCQDMPQPSLESEHIDAPESVHTDALESDNADALEESVWTLQRAPPNKESVHADDLDYPF